MHPRAWLLSMFSLYSTKRQNLCAESIGQPPSESALFACPLSPRFRLLFLCTSPFLVNGALNLCMCQMMLPRCAGLSAEYTSQLPSAFPSCPANITSSATEMPGTTKTSSKDPVRLKATAYVGHAGKISGSPAHLVVEGQLNQGVLWVLLDGQGSHFGQVGQAAQLMHACALRLVSADRDAQGLRRPHILPL